MVPIGRIATVVAVCIVVLSGLAMLAELELVSYSGGGPMRWPSSREYTRADYGTDILINPAARLPNERRKGGEWLPFGIGWGCCCGGTGGRRRRERGNDEGRERIIPGTNFARRFY